MFNTTWYFFMWVYHLLPNLSLIRMLSSYFSAINNVLVNLAHSSPHTHPIRKISRSGTPRSKGMLLRDSVPDFKLPSSTVVPASATTSGVKAPAYRSLSPTSVAPGLSVVEVSLTPVAPCLSSALCSSLHTAQS